MDGKEFRLGNLVNFEQTTHIITEIALNLCRSVLHCKNPGEIYIHGYSELKPIPITEEWLLKFGFEKFEKDFSITFNEFSKFGVGLNGERWYYGLDYLNKNQFYPGMIGYIDYVHQLQNLYFALTGEELTLKK